MLQPRRHVHVKSLQSAPAYPSGLTSEYRPVLQSSAQLAISEWSSHFLPLCLCPECSVLPPTPHTMVSLHPSLTIASFQVLLIRSLFQKPSLGRRNTSLLSSPQCSALLTLWLYYSTPGVYQLPASYLHTGCS